MCKRVYFILSMYTNVTITTFAILSRLFIFIYFFLLIKLFSSFFFFICNRTVSAMCAVCTYMHDASNNKLCIVCFFVEKYKIEKQFLLCSQSEIKKKLYEKCFTRKTKFTVPKKNTRKINLFTVTFVLKKKIRKFLLVCNTFNQLCLNSSELWIYSKVGHKKSKRM